MVELAENKATQPSLAGAWAELGNSILLPMNLRPPIKPPYLRDYLCIYGPLENIIGYFMFCLKHSNSEIMGSLER